MYWLSVLILTFLVVSGFSFKDIANVPYSSSFIFKVSLSNINSLMFWDWTISEAIERHSNRYPDCWEKSASRN